MRVEEQRWDERVRREREDREKQWARERNVVRLEVEAEVRSNLDEREVRVVEKLSDVVMTKVRHSLSEMQEGMSFELREIRKEVLHPSHFQQNTLP